MTSVSRVLDPSPVRSLDDYIAAGGGTGVEAAVRMGGDAVLEEITASGLRGRGGGGFPTGIKWRTVVENRDDSEPLTVVVNAAEGEPGSFKDRTLVRRNPYRVVEGALIAARTVGADRVHIATKESFRPERDRLERAIAEVIAAGLCEGIAFDVVTGPDEYLFGEETAMLEVLEGRGPFPRIAPPYRRGLDTVGVEGHSAEALLTGPDSPGAGQPVLINNVETMAHVAMIMANGPNWFRELGTPESPGTILCTVSGDVNHSGVAEFAMGTPLSEAISTIGGGVRTARRFVAALSGVAAPLLPAELFDTPLTFEDMAAAGSGLGAAGFIVFDDGTDLIGVVEGVSRFLSVESCGQCYPCKYDGLVITDLLDRARRGNLDARGGRQLADRVRTITKGARCYLATQHQAVVGSLLSLFPDAIAERVAQVGVDVRLGDEGDGDEVDDDDEGPALIAPIVDIVDGEAMLDVRQADKQPDWTFDGTDSGQSPADRMELRRPV
ncbi:MAG: SLBB domain-containing protein [Acidimicrobiia bacterium]|nr:SLBB domain-containing protein [Acidimicrobiia bacterium]